MLDLKRLQYLEAVYRYKSFTRASEALYVSQPAISTAISSLEDELGLKLITRSSKKVEFTHEGEELVFQFIRILDLCQETERIIKDVSASAKQHLRFGISSSISGSIAPAIFSDFLSLHPHVQIQLEEGAMNEHLSLLQNGDLDLAYNALPDSSLHDNLKSIPINSAKVFAVLHPSHPLTKLDEIPLEMLKSEKLIMTSVKSKVMELMMDAFEKINITPDIVLCYSQIACMVDVVQICNYVGIISVVGDQPTTILGNLILRPIGQLSSFPVGFIMNKNRYLPTAGYELISFVKKLVSNTELLNI